MKNKLFSFAMSGLLAATFVLSTSPASAQQQVPPALAGELDIGLLAQGITDSEAEARFASHRVYGYHAWLLGYYAMENALYGYYFFPYDESYTFYSLLCAYYAYLWAEYAYWYGSRADSWETEWWAYYAYEFGFYAWYYEGYSPYMDMAAILSWLTSECAYLDALGY